MIVLGLNAYHGDSSAALVRDGVLVAAAEEERFTRTKHWAGFPSQSIAYCLKQAGLGLSDVDHVAVNQDSRANRLRKAWYAATHLNALRLTLEKLRNRKDRQGIPSLLEQAFPGQKFKGEFHNVEHHLAHLSSAFHVSPFSDAVVVSIDGFGDFASAAWGVGRGTRIDVEGRVLFPHSLGQFYQALTQYLGFPNYGDEYKVMGLAPYGQPSFMPEMDELVKCLPNGTFTLNLKYFTHHFQPLGNLQWVNGSPEFSELFTSELEKLLGPRRRPNDALEQRHRDIAHSIQAKYEQSFFNLIQKCQQSSGLLDIALAGGCAANSVANGKIRRKTNFKRVYVQAAAGDAGGAIGSAFVVWHRLHNSRSFVMDHAYWGPEFSSSNIASLLDAERSQIEAEGCSIVEHSDDAELCTAVAKDIAKGKVVGWFQGRMEWGPRALGNRSIVCDPRRTDMKALLNSKIKRRESFRPFAPSILEEEVANWFEEDDAVPFMMQVFQIREERRSQIPAVTHVDGSGRLQTVSQATNPRYYLLIDKFKAETGVPIVLNTSFNENEPVVCNPREALDCFLRTKMDLLVLDNVVVSRREQ